MAIYTSKYSELSFYAGGKLKSFSNGIYITEDKEEIDVLDTLTDAVKQAEEAPAKPKAPAKKASAK